MALPGPRATPSGVVSLHPICCSQMHADMRDSERDRERENACCNTALPSSFVMQLHGLTSRLQALAVVNGGPHVASVVT